LSRFSDEVGRLWCRLADFYIRSGAFERARDVFEEAAASVTTVRTCAGTPFSLTLDFCFSSS
jgi:pre-mRNA-splicing factor SYF1